MGRVFVVAIAAAAIALAAPVSAQTRVAQTRVTLSTGVDYSSGDYGQAVDTEVISVPFTMRVANENWAFRATIPYLEITGPADVADVEEGGAGGSGGGQGGGAAVSRAGTERGLGDVTISLTRSFRRLGGSHMYFDTTARVRLPTGDEDKGLGVGARDYSLGGEIGRSAPEGGAYFNLARRFLGDRTGAAPRDDGWQAGAGAWRHLSERMTIGASAYWREASRPQLDDPAEIGVNASYRVSTAWRVSAHVGGGLSDASPGISSGVRLTWRSTGGN